MTLNVNDSDTQNTLAIGGDGCQIGEAVTLNYGASPNPVTSRQWSSLITFAGVAQTFDMTNLAGLRGDVENFSVVYLIYLYNLATATGYTLKVGNAVANPFSAFFDAATDVYTLPMGSRMLFENHDTGWTVDATHKNLKLDPGANTFTAKILIVGV